MKTRHGFCQCGCGEKTNIAAQTDSRRGHVKGEPFRYIAGHQLKPRRGAKNPNWQGGRIVRPDGYVMLRDDSHPRANGAGYVYEHIIVAEQATGRPIPTSAQVHHVNGDPSDNRPANLVVCEDQDYHRLLHRRAESLEACGNAGWMRCKYCKEYDAPANLVVPPEPRRSSFHAECNREYCRQYYLRKKAGAA